MKRLCLATSAVSFFALAGCSSGAPPEATGSSEEAIVTATGVDYSFARPSPSGLKSGGYTFAARYLSPPPNGKNLSKSEADALWAAGVDVVVVFEQGASNALGGHAQGVTDATIAEAQAKADGMPAFRPIYFAIDFDAQPADMSAIDAYFDGVASVIGVARTGAYGGDRPLKQLFDTGKIRWGWQTYAWSYGTWDPRAQLRQVQNGITAAGDTNCCDKDEAQTKDYGQWHVTGEDPCDTAADGYYCGQSTQWAGGTKDHLYHCAGGKTASDVPCADGCVSTPVGKPDYCATPDAGPGGDGGHEAGGGDGGAGSDGGGALDGATDDAGGVSVDADGGGPAIASTHGGGGCGTSRANTRGETWWIVIGALGVGLFRQTGRRRARAGSSR